MKGRNIDIPHLITFGCTCYVHIQTVHRDKLEPRAVKSVFLGYSSSQKGYKYYNPHNGKVGISRDVRFDEYAPFFLKGCSEEPQGESLMDIFPLPTPTNLHEGNPQNAFLNHHSEHRDDKEPQSDQENLVNIPQPALAPRRNPTRNRHPPLRLQEYIMYNARHPISKALTYKKLSTSHATFINQLSTNVEPRNLNEVAHIQVWQEAMKEELKALNDNQT